MALTPDQRALLQLLCERGQSYSDLAGLLDIPENQVRARARAALTELGGADPDAEVGVTDYLLGQADPIGRADAVRFLQQDPVALELAGVITTKLQALAPNAELPRLPEPRGRRRKPAAGAPAAAAKRAPASPPSRGPADRPREARQTRLIALMAGAGVMLLFVVLAVAGVFSGDDGAAETPDTPSAEVDGSLGELDANATTVELSPRGGSGVAGEATFGVAEDTLFVDLDLEGLDPEPEAGRVHVLWLMLTEEAGYPVQIIFPDESGRVRDRLPVPGPVAVTVGSSARFVVVSESESGPLERVIDQAVERDSPIVPFSGESLARGRIPAAQGARGSGGGDSNGG